ncbi:MAG: TFIIB-type zinc ribbon-containing protein [Eubacterium sp.]|nr:TFIIB-type zinc ribbon-containing protein [Eubacterium sp.]
MELKALVCPHCSANIKVDPRREYTVCSYCGTQIVIDELLNEEDKHDFDDENSFERTMERGMTYIKLKKWGNARGEFVRMINHFPEEPLAYYYYVYADSFGFKRELLGELNIPDYEAKARSMKALIGDEESQEYKEMTAYIQRIRQKEMMEDKRKRNAKEVDLENIFEEYDSKKKSRSKSREMTSSAIVFLLLTVYGFVSGNDRIAFIGCVLLIVFFILVVITKKK